MGKELDRIVAGAYAEFEAKLFRSICESLSADTRSKLGELLTETAELSFSDLKSDPGRLGLGSILAESRKLRYLISLRLNPDVFKQVNTRVLSRYRQRVASETGWEVRRHPENTPVAMLAIFAFIRQREIIDGIDRAFLQNRTQDWCSC